MTKVYVLTFVCAIVLLTSVEANLNETSPTGDSFSDYVKKAADFIAYSSIDLMISEGSNSHSANSTSEHPLGDETGRILEIIGLIVLITILISFVVVPSVIACILCSGGFCRRGNQLFIKQNFVPKLQHINLYIFK